MEDYLEKLEHERGIILPPCYKLFYMQCAVKTPRNLVGTDLFNHWPDLNEGAINILKENNKTNFLKPDDFVFMMHQGYIFWYFKADGNPDPMVYMFHEMPEYGHVKQNVFSEFIKEFLD